MRNLLRALHLGALFLAAGCHQSHASEAPSPPPGEVWISQQQAETAKLVTAPVAEREVGGAIVTSGRVTFDDLRVSHVFSPVTGRVTKIEAQLGEKVKKGQTLAIIDSPDLGLAGADLAKADADLLAAEHDYNRQKTLLPLHAVSEKDMENAEDNYRKAKAELERARQKARLLGGGGGQTYALRSLIDGAVIARGTNPGMEVQGQYSGASAAVELFTVGDIDQVWVLSDAFEMDLPRIKPGAHVSVKVVAYPDKVFEGTVDWVADALDPTTRTAKVRCVFPNPDHLLKPEMFATVSISVDGRKRLALPRSAVLHLGDQTVVFVQEGEGEGKKLRFERRPVVVDEDEPGDLVPVTRGVEPGENVVTSGAILLSSV